jgi:hypothetical protein
VLTPSEEKALFVNVSVAELKAILEVTRSLVALIKEDALPRVVRSPMAALDERTILNVLRDEGAAPVELFLQMLRELIPGSDPIRAGDERLRKRFD